MYFVLLPVNLCFLIILQIYVDIIMCAYVEVSIYVCILQYNGRLSCAIINGNGKYKKKTRILMIHMSRNKTKNMFLSCGLSESNLN